MKFAMRFSVKDNMARKPAHICKECNMVKFLIRTRLAWNYSPSPLVERRPVPSSGLYMDWMMLGLYKYFYVSPFIFLEKNISLVFNSVFQSLKRHPIKISRRIQRNVTDGQKVRQTNDEALQLSRV